MYAAAGGASIASRRKQKRLQLSKQLTPQPPASSRTKAPTRASRGVYTTKFLSTHIPTTTTSTTTTATTLYLPAPPPSSAFISSHEHHRHRRRRSPGKPATPYRLTPLVSPIQFPISPPPLSLESSNSLSLPLHSNNFPFPPSAFLDLRVSPTTSDFQCGSQGPGKAAWQGCSRPSPLPLSPSSLHGSRCEGYKTKQCEAHRRWMKRNRIRDVSYCYGSSEEDDEDGSWTGRRRPEMNAAMNTVLYAGLGTTALGLVISFVGTGEKGFLSPELRLLGPTLLCAGLLCCLLRVLLCLCLCRCGGDCQWKPCKIVIVDKKKVRKTEKKVLASPSRQCASLLPQCSNQTTTLTTRTTTTMMAMSPLPCSSSHSDTLKGHELLLSPAQLPE